MRLDSLAMSRVGVLPAALSRAQREIAWTVLGQIQPPLGHVYGYLLEPGTDGGTRVTSYYDWSKIDESWRAAAIFPVISEGALRATLGILARTVRRGYPQSRG